MDEDGKMEGGSLAGEQVIERLRRLNDALNQQLKKQRDRLKQQTNEHQRYMCREAGSLIDK